MNYKNFFQSKLFRGVLYGCGALVIVLVIFQAGMVIGFKKASFSFRGGEEYYRAFGGRDGRSHGDERRGFMGMMPNGFMGGALMNSYGASGRVIKVQLPVLVLEDQEGVEKAVRITDQTQVRQFRDSLKPEDIKVNDFVVAFGDPNDSAEIVAQLIRIMSGIPGASASTSTTVQ